MHQEIPSFAERLFPSHDHELSGLTTRAPDKHPIARLNTAVGSDPAASVKRATS